MQLGEWLQKIILSDLYAPCRTEVHNFFEAKGRKLEARRAESGDRVLGRGSPAASRESEGAL